MRVGRLAMKLIERPHYLKQLISVRDTPDIKVITGIRRSGKSKLMASFIEWLACNEPDAHVIDIDLTSLSFESLREYHRLNAYVEAHYHPGKANYLFIDEVQNCTGLEIAINSLHASEKYRIFITGSNAFLLSSDLATLFTGRAIEIEVYPFSFWEFMAYFAYPDIQEALDSYIIYGGMSGGYVYSEPSERFKYIQSVWNTLILRDIKQKYKLRNVNGIERISEFMLDNISNLSSSRNIASTLSSAQNSITYRTVQSYMNYLCNAFAFYKFRRYDVRGKKYLANHEKYYLCDHAFKYAKLGIKNLDFGRTLENIVAIELLRRGYEVYVGVLYKTEIDFVAIRRDEKIYIQVAEDVSQPETLLREITPLLKVHDAYPRMVIARTRHPVTLYEGIPIWDAAQWLLDLTDGR